MADGEALRIADYSTEAGFDNAEVDGVRPAGGGDVADTRHLYSRVHHEGIAFFQQSIPSVGV